MSAAIILFSSERESAFLLLKFIVHFDELDCVLLLDFFVEQAPFDHVFDGNLFQLNPQVDLLSDLPDVFRHDGAQRLAL